MPAGITKERIMNTTENQAIVPSNILTEYGATAQQCKSEAIRNEVYKEAAFESGKSHGMNDAYHLVNEMAKANLALAPVATALFYAWIDQSHRVTELAANFHDEIAAREKAAGIEL